MGEEYVIGLKPYGFKIEFFSDPIPIYDAADLVMKMRHNLGKDANLYICRDGKRRKVSDSQLTKLMKD